jgi:hypothetical protein
LSVSFDIKASYEITSQIEIIRGAPCLSDKIEVPTAPFDEERLLTGTRRCIMGTRYIVFALFCLLHSVSSLARPVLVAVDLPDRESIKQWCLFDYPTYSFIENTAIAEIDERELTRLAIKRLSYHLIDSSPWVDPYVIFFQAPREAPDHPGSPIWQKGSVALREVPRGTLPTVLRTSQGCYELERKALPDRFWDQMQKVMVPVEALAWDPWVQSLVDQVSEDSLTACIQRLIAFETRSATHESCFAAAQWLSQRLSGWGYATVIQEFATWYPGNVIATRIGATMPSEMKLIGGHYDSRPAFGYAPGADDNATGTAATLETARVFADCSFDYTMQFICWSAEEEGRVGSRYFVEEAQNLGLELGGYVNLDMIGYMDDDQLDCETHSEGTFSYPLVRLFIEAAATYVPNLSVVLEEYPGSSDWRSFVEGGYTAVGGIEHDGTHYNPNYHSTDDEFWTLSPELYTAITKAAVATMALLGVSPPMVENIGVHDGGDGESLEVRWAVCEAPDVTGYLIQWGTESEAYSESAVVFGAETTSLALTGLLTDTTYYFVVRAYDQDGYQSWAAMEVSGVPSIVPHPPLGVTAIPVADGIRIDWLRNNELDVAGYRVFRRINEAPAYDSLNVALLSDTTFTDAPLAGENRYFYAIRAIDESENYSSLSEEVYGRPMTLDQGVLIVDETRNTPNIPDSLQDAFYRYVTEGYRISEIEYGAADALVLADLAPYSTVMWHADEYSEALAGERTVDLACYLDGGGNVWFMGWKPAIGLADTLGYPLDFLTGDLIYDYFGISGVELSGSADLFQAAIGTLGYPVLQVDPDKVPIPSWGQTLKFIEALSSVAPAADIYTIDLVNDGSPFEGAVCGVRYLDSAYQTVYLGFPLYFMDQEQARVLAREVLSDFGELPVDEEFPGGPLVTEFKLLQNTPNPFSRNTIITYQIPLQGAVTLEIYNVAGRLVRTLVSNEMSEGSYDVEWKGTDAGDQNVGNGVYFYQLRVHDHTLSRKMVLIR